MERDRFVAIHLLARYLGKSDRKFWLNGSRQRKDKVQRPLGKEMKLTQTLTLMISESNYHIVTVGCYYIFYIDGVF